MQVVCRGLVFLTLCGLAGCGDGLNRQGVTGTVTYKGKPVVIGSVIFNPLDASAVTTGGAAIKDGKYEILQPQGLAPGRYRVSFTAMDKTVNGPTVPGDAMPAAKDMPKEVLPPKYGAESKVEAEVKASGKNVLDFNLD